MTYNFQDEPSPTMPTEIEPDGTVVLQEGSPQGDLITGAFSGDTVSVSIVPPSGWTLDFVSWPDGSNGTFKVPDPGVEETHAFSYVVSQGGTRLSSGGQFKIKKQSSGGGG